MNFAKLRGLNEMHVFLTFSIRMIGSIVIVLFLCISYLQDFTPHRCSRTLGFDGWHSVRCSTNILSGYDRFKYNIGAISSQSHVGPVKEKTVDIKQDSPIVQVDFVMLSQWLK
jgi:hypothetical protein